MNNFAYYGQVVKSWATSFCFCLLYHAGGHDDVFFASPRDINAGASNSLGWEKYFKVECYTPHEGTVVDYPMFALYYMQQAPQRILKKGLATLISDR